METKPAAESDGTAAAPKPGNIVVVQSPTEKTGASHGSTELQSPIATAGERIAPRSEGGHGFVSADSVRSWVLRDVPETHAPSLQLNVTSGTVRRDVRRDIRRDHPRLPHMTGSPPHSLSLCIRRCARLSSSTLPVRCPPSTSTSTSAPACASCNGTCSSTHSCECGRHDFSASAHPPQPHLKARV